MVVLLLIVIAVLILLIYNYYKEMKNIYTNITRFIKYVDELLERLRLLDDRIAKVEKQRATHDR